MTTSAMPTKLELEKQLAEAKTAVDVTVKAHETLMQSESAKPFADQDFEAQRISLGNMAKAKNAVIGAETLIKDFDAGMKFAALESANQGIRDVLHGLITNPPAYKLASLHGTLAIGEDSEIHVSLTPVADFDILSIEAAIATIGKRNLARYRDAGVTELALVIDKDGAVSVAKPNARKPRVAKAVGTASNGGTRRNLTTEFDAVASAAQHAHLDSILEEEKGGSSNSKSYAYKMSVIEGRATA